ncbi:MULTISPECIES: DUF6127 family protein [Sphingomonas]|uniref:DUF6127 family protein n=1 Tax=Sphingomonas kyungheensis TaxID=1069987 RepID=A0ABU8H7E5_9SPHN|nr:MULTISPECIES: DUF6127 family protein [unclassified Sphingomonas]EZP51200.1 hypothetical protein BW41_02855 [Sphingomonas sp. RIT328]
MSEVLAQLMAQAAREGSNLATMRAIAEEAGELSAMRALKRLGLADEEARDDLAALRELLATWRDAKRSAWKALAGWLMRLAGALLLAGFAVKLGWRTWLE